MCCPFGRLGDVFWSPGVGSDVCVVRGLRGGGLQVRLCWVGWVGARKLAEERRRRRCRLGALRLMRGRARLLLDKQQGQRGSGHFRFESIFHEKNDLEIVPVCFDVSIDLLIPDLIKSEEIKKPETSFAHNIRAASAISDAIRALYLQSEAGLKQKAQISLEVEAKDRVNTLLASAKNGSYGADGQSPAQKKIRKLENLSKELFATEKRYLETLRILKDISDKVETTESDQQDVLRDVFKEIPSLYMLHNYMDDKFYQSPSRTSVFGWWIQIFTSTELAPYFNIYKAFLSRVRTKYETLQSIYDKDKLFQQFCQSLVEMINQALLINSKLDGRRSDLDKLSLFIRSGPCLKIPRRSVGKRPLNRHLFLFSDYLIITEPETVTTGHYLVKSELTIVSMILEDPKLEDDIPVERCIRVRAVECVVELMFAVHHTLKSGSWNPKENVLRAASTATGQESVVPDTIRVTAQWGIVNLGSKMSINNTIVCHVFTEFEELDGAEKGTFNRDLCFNVEEAIVISRYVGIQSYGFKIIPLHISKAMGKVWQNLRLFSDADEKLSWCKSLEDTIEEERHRNNLTLNAVSRRQSVYKSLRLFSLSRAITCAKHEIVLYLSNGFWVEATTMTEVNQYRRGSSHP
ncbi:hypothetical protein TSMEX_011323 [Taenia solium]|eukprot:TsM_000333800 transcript=TsM_000333800 gene=TsM_000333800